MKCWQISLINKEQQRFGLRKLSIGVASVLLGTTVYFGLGGTVAHADSQVNTVPNNTGNEEINSNVKVPYAAPIEPAQAQKVVNSAVNYDSNVVNSDTVNSNVENTNSVNNVADNKVEANNNIVANFATQEMTINRNQVQPASVAQVEASTVQSSNNGGFDSNTWGTLDVSKWQGQVVSNKDIDGATRQYYQLTGYTGNNDQIVVPNGADFQKAGVNTGGYQVGVTSQFMYDLSHRDQNAKSIAFSNTDSQQIKALNSDWGNSSQKDLQGVFEGENLTNFDGRGLDTTNVTDMRNFFQNNRLSDVSTLANWKTGNVQNFENMFSNNQLNDINPLTNWNTSNVVNMGSMFKNNQLTKIPKNNWDTSSVTDMSTMFASNQLNDLAGLSTWNTSKVAHMAFMFQVNKIDDLSPLTNWDTGSATSMRSMFNGNQIKNLNPLANWDLSHVTSTSGMFNSNVLNDISGAKNWNVGNVVNMSGMFLHNQLTNLTPLTNWQTGNVTDMSSMFGENRINQLNGLEKWDTSRVKDTHYMFGENWVGNLIPLKDWNVSQVTNMNYMFGENWLGNLNGTENWDVRNVKDMGSMFQLNHLSDISALKNWQTDSLQSARYMFNNDQISDLSALKDWKLNHAENLESMFRHNFISDVLALSGWNTDKVTNFNAMFQDNQIKNLLPLANWQVNQATNFSNMFANNQVALADFRKWIFKPNMNVYHMLQQPDYHVVVLINTKSMNHDDVMHVISSDAFIDVKANQIYLNGEATSVGIMYGTDDLTSSAVDLLRKLISEDREKTINADLRLYHSQSHNTVFLVAPDPTGDDYTVPVVMANQKYRVVVSNKVTYQFVDDDNAGAKVGSAIIVSGEDWSMRSTNLVLPEHYGLATGQRLPKFVMIQPSDRTVMIHLVHTQYNVVIKYLDLSGFLVDSQIITGKWGTVHQIGTLHVSQNYVLQSIDVPSEVEIQPEDTEMDLVVAPTETYRSFVTSKDADLHRSVTRIITVTLPDKSTKTVVQTVNFGRNAWTNNQTHQVTYSDWQADSPQKFVAYIPDAVSGYVPGVVKSQQVLADSQNVMVSVGYTPIQQAVKHPYIDASGHVYDVIPTGYHVVVGQTASDGAMLLAKDVVIKPVAVEFVTRTVTIKLPNNHVRIIHQRVRKGTQFGKVAIPHLRGYKIVVSNNASLGRVVAGQDMNLTVTFEKL